MQPTDLRSVKKATFAPLDYLDWDFRLDEGIHVTRDVDVEFINSPSTPHTLSLSQISFRAGV